MNAPASVRARALELLRQALADPIADFRSGQWEAIEALVQRRARLLVVQRTGWGKSAVYFLSTKLLRQQGAGPTLLVSPLLALMRNQLDAASGLGIRSYTVNSTNRDDWARIEQLLHADKVDVLLVSPERFANEDFVTRMLLPLAARVGLFVVDEAHCISDWVTTSGPITAGFCAFSGVCRRMCRCVPPPQLQTIASLPTSRHSSDLTLRSCAVR